MTETTTKPAAQATTAKKKPPARKPVLHGIPEIRSFLRTNQTPLYFIGATAFNLLGLDRWVRNFNYIVCYDSFDGAHPHVFAPSEKPDMEFGSSEEINNYLLRHPQVQDYIGRRGGTPKVAMVFFDHETEAICRELGYQLVLPPADLRSRLDSKLETTRLAEQAGVPSVPNTLATAGSYDELLRLAAEAGLGDDLVVQLAYGDSGKTTFFIASESDWNAQAEAITGTEVKVMRRINPRPLAVEAVLTSNGTIVGPVMGEFTGYPELTPYRGGWCGNDLLPDTLTDQQRERIVDLVRRIGARLDTEGYKGFFEVDILLDTDTGELYLGELNPRITGATSITNVTAGAYADIPLFLFHLLEYFDIDTTFDVDEINERWSQLATVDAWSQIVIKELGTTVEHIQQAPPSGLWLLAEDGTVQFERPTPDWHALQDESECFFLRIYGPGDYRFKGADLGIVLTKGRLQTGDPWRLTERGKRLVETLRTHYTSTPLDPGITAPATGPGLGLKT